VKPLPKTKKDSANQRAITNSGFEHNKGEYNPATLEQGLLNHERISSG
jgi:hypothetical protein